MEGRTDLIYIQAKDQVKHAIDVDQVSQPQITPFWNDYGSCMPPEFTEMAQFLRFITSGESDGETRHKIIGSK
jgi:hypothetical protein